MASPPEFVDDYLPALLGQAGDLSAAAFHRALREQGMATAEWRVLATLAGGRPISTGRLAQVSLTKGPTATRLLDRMQAAGLVARQAHGADRRVSLVQITPQGRRLAARLMALARSHEQQVLQALDPDEARALKTLLRALIGRLRAPGTEATDPPGS
jgi:DNA-binding MarR family transcriptional regulator